MQIIALDSAFYSYIGARKERKALDILKEILDLAERLGMTARVQTTRSRIKGIEDAIAGKAEVSVTISDGERKLKVKRWWKVAQDAVHSGTIRDFES